MSMKKRLLTAALAAALMMTALTGCGGSASSDAAGSDAAGSASGEKVKIQYWHINGENQGGAAVQAYIDEFNASQDAIEVEGRFNDGYDGLLKNLQADTAAGNAPAIVQVSWSNIEYFPANFAYTSPEEIISSEFPEDKDFLTNTFEDSILDLARNSDGILAGVPYSISNPVLFYNADLLREAGLSEDGPKDWDEFVSFAKAVKEKTGKYGAYLQEGDTWVLQAILESGGASMLTRDGDTATATFASEKGKAAMQAYADLVLKDQSAVHLTTLDEGLKAFNDGEIAMCICSIAKATNIINSANFDVRSTTFPTFAGEERAVPAGGCYLAITAQSTEEQKAAWEFIKFLCSDDNAAKWVAGTGYVPSTKGAENSQILKDYLETNPLMQAAMDQRADAVQWTAWPGSALEAQQALVDMRDQILGGTKDVSTAMDECQAKVQGFIEG
jgi:multiple sugar transport system substrate-binding protein